MNRQNRLNRFSVLAQAGIIAALMLLTAASDAAAALPEALRRTIETAPFSQEAKTQLLTAAEHAVSSGIPAQDVEVIINRGVGRGADPRTLNAMLDTVLSIHGKNLPVRPVLDRIQQGLAKGVPQERIVAAAQRLAEQLSTAQPLVAGAVEKGLKPAGRVEQDRAIETVARALEKGISEQSITRTGVLVQERKGPFSLFDRSVDTIDGMSGNGMPAETAVRLVHAAVSKGFSESDLAGMEKDVTRERARGRSMEDIATRMETRIANSRPGQGYRSLDTDTMRGPGFGTGGGSGFGGRMERRR